jgi:hypothetical protein
MVVNSELQSSKMSEISSSVGGTVNVLECDRVAEWEHRDAVSLYKWDV